ncbi:MAG TPA: toll/interleukin-1 receptor domain-containing protein [Xanthobacteraceae bacterium]|jgi:hypothetical protein
MTCDIFILHAGKDKPAAQAVEKALSEAGFDCKADHWDIKRPPKCRVAVLIFTRHVQDIVDLVGSVLWNKTPIVALLFEEFNPSGNLRFYLKHQSVQRMPARKMPAFDTPVEQSWPELTKQLARTVPKHIAPPRFEPQIVPARDVPAYNFSARDVPLKRPDDEQPQKHSDHKHQQRHSDHVDRQKHSDHEHSQRHPDHEHSKSEADRLPVTRSRDLIGFFSYSHRDNNRGSISALKSRIEEELNSLFGRNVVLWHDQSSIRGGAKWRQEILKGIGQAEFFIPIVTPNTVRNSPYCRYEYEQFLVREQDFKVQDRIFPLHYIDVEDLKQEEFWNSAEWLTSMEERQWFDWRRLRHNSWEDHQVKVSVTMFCEYIKEALQLNKKTGKSATLENPSATTASDGSAHER